MFCVPGTAIVTDDKAAMWTDGRYFLQSQAQMDSNWTLMKDGRIYMSGRMDNKQWIHSSEFIWMKQIYVFLCPFSDLAFSICMCLLYNIENIQEIQVIL